ncbi:cilia- and flagella-associated protein 100-like [Hydractinia symbiolongicarpus]|uniref:cilia- and flagella-associated protein 100-like n=1 Tax=Hydractinia symbiolongicarpus TaxID=13093 RepID=UPI00254E9656|nr:cilia- and flagella-associated protein 100-like [Hydractinia symbiolongicarpus]
MKKTDVSNALVPVTQELSLKNNKARNPFKVPMDHDIFALRDKEKQRKKIEREVQKKQKVHEKTTYTYRINARTKAMIRPAGDTDNDLTDEEDKEKDGTMILKDDPGFVLSTTKDRHVEKEHLDDYIAKKREMFLVQYSLGVKRDEMRKLEEVAQAEEKKLELAEQYLEEDATMFDEFLKDNDKNAVEAIKIAEAETKAKLEKVTEIKKINAQMMAIISEISKNEDLLKEYMLYKRFLDKLTPREVLEERRKKKLERKRDAQKESGKVTQDPSPKKKLSTVMERDKMSRLSTRTVRTKSVNSPSTHRSRLSRAEFESDNTSVISQDTQISDEEDSDEEPELYFTNPSQMLDIFSELEEQNLSLIQNSQDTEEALDEMKKTIVQTKEKMNRETEALKLQIETLREATRREEEKAAELEMKSRMFSFGEFKAEDQEKMLLQLNKKVEEVYANCIGDNEANISTLQMLTNIENRLEELFEMIEMMPPDKVELAEKAKDRERRLRLREEKLLAQKRHQEERIRKAIERAQAEPKKKTGRRLVFRSCPPQTRRREDDTQEKNDKEDEELKYFFT